MNNQKKKEWEEKNNLKVGIIGTNSSKKRTLNEAIQEAEKKRSTLEMMAEIYPDIKRKLDEGELESSLEKSSYDLIQKHQGNER